MGLLSFLSDPLSKLTARVLDLADRSPSLAVATTQQKHWYQIPTFFSNAEKGIDMHVDGQFSGTPLKVHDGTDSILWTATNIVDNKWKFSDPTFNHTPAGALSISAKDTKNGDTARITSPTLVDLTGYTALTGYIYITKWDGASGCILSAYNTVAGTVIGNEVNLGDYVSTNQLNQWMKFSISFVDLGVTGQIIDALDLRAQKGDSDPDFYLDDIQLEETGTPYTFSVKPPVGKETYLDSFTFFFVAPYYPVAGEGLGSDAILQYDTLFHLPSLDAGILFQEVINGQVALSFQAHDYGDLIQYDLSQLTEANCDGVNTHVKIKYILKHPLRLRASEEDRVSFSISDDLSTFLRLRCSASLKVEVLT